MLPSIEASTEAIEQTGLYHRVYRPEGSTKTPLVVLVHGRAGDAKVMWVFSKMLAGKNVTVVSPQGFVPDEIGGFSWWDVSLSRENEGENLAEKLTLLNAPLDKLKSFIESASKIYNTDPGNVITAGFSQGAGVISSLSLREPGIFRAVGLLSGFVPKTAMEQIDLINPKLKNSDSALKQKLPEYFLFHGTEDAVLPSARAYQAKEFLEGLGANVELKTDAVGHKVSSQGIKDFGTWVNKFI
jgi:phospholipase/carboxylesterase